MSWGGCFLVDRHCIPDTGPPGELTNQRMSWRSRAVSILHSTSSLPRASSRNEHKKKISCEGGPEWGWPAEIPASLARSHFFSLASALGSIVHELQPTAPHCGLPKWSVSGNGSMPRSRRKAARTFFDSQKPRKLLIPRLAFRSRVWLGLPVALASQHPSTGHFPTLGQWGQDAKTGGTLVLRHVAMGAVCNVCTVPSRSAVPGAMPVIASGLRYPRTETVCVCVCVSVG